MRSFFSLTRQSTRLSRRKFSFRSCWSKEYKTLFRCSRSSLALLDLVDSNNLLQNVQTINYFPVRNFGLWNVFTSAVQWVADTVVTAVNSLLGNTKKVNDYVYSAVNTSEPPVHAPKKEEKEIFPLPKFPDFSTSDINVAIIGDSGNGKSSFINTYLDKAQTGFVETTGVGSNKIRSYVYEVNSQRKVLFWDLPGCGTTTYPFKEYIKQMGLKHFDYCLLITSTRFTEHDDNLIQELHRLSVPFYVIRSKLDSDLSNHCHDNNINYQLKTPEEQQNIINNMKKEIEKDVKRSLAKSYPLLRDRFYILSSHCAALTADDWMELQQQLIFDLLNTRNADKTVVKEVEEQWGFIRKQWEGVKAYVKEQKEAVFGNKNKKQQNVKQMEFREKFSYNGDNNVSHWDVNEVCQWLQDTVKLPQYVKVFEDEEIDGQALMGLDKKMIKQMGITKVGHISKISQEISKLK